MNAGIPCLPACLAEEPVDRVVCASEATSGEAAYRQLEAIREHATRNNTPQQVRSVLACRSGWFIFWAEGPHAAIKEALGRARRSHLHRGMRLLHHSVGPRMLVDDWTMGMMGSNEPHELTALRVERLRNEMALGRQFAPGSVFRRLALPLAPSLAMNGRDPDRSFRVAVCESHAGAQGGFLRWLAEHSRQPLLHHRWAGASGLDVGVDSVDVLCDELPVRALKLARRALEFELVRLLATDWHDLVLVFDGDHRTDEALMLKACRMLNGLQGAPKVLGVAPNPEVHAQMLHWAAVCGFEYAPLPLRDEDDFAGLWEAITRRASSEGAPESTLWPVGSLAAPG